MISYRPVPPGAAAGKTEKREVSPTSRPCDGLDYSHVDSICQFLQIFKFFTDILKIVMFVILEIIPKAAPLFLRIPHKGLQAF